MRIQLVINVMQNNAWSRVVIHVYFMIRFQDVNGCMGPIIILNIYQLFILQHASLIVKVPH